MADVGKILIIPRGDYDPSATYYILDVVRFNNMTFMARVNNLTNVAPPTTPTSDANWMFLVADGGGATTLGSLTDVDVTSATDGQYLKYVNDGTNPPEWVADDAAAALSELTDVDPTSTTSPTTNQILKYNGTKWAAAFGGSGHTMLPNPTSSVTEADVVTAINGAVLADGGANDDVASLFGVAKWSNTMTKTYYVQGIAGNTTPIGKTGIGTWCVDGSDETGWITIPELIGIGSKEHSINITYDPSKSGIIIRGGYVIDDTTGKMCIKFANEISEADTHTAKIGIEITIKRTENNPVSF